MRFFVTAAAVLSILFHLTAVTVAVPAGSACGKHGILERKEWRTLSDHEKRTYIDAVKCLQSTPAHNTSRPASWTRFDEFQAHHIDSAIDIHFVGQFLPWHRQYVKVYETALRECGYDGAHPYWNWSLDADGSNLISQSPLWDPITGFGGDGVPNTYTVPADPSNTSRIIYDAYRGCVLDGPFANYTLKLGPGLLATEHCLTRGITDVFRSNVTSEAVARVLAVEGYDRFRVQLEGTVSPVLYFAPHLGGHISVGGEMSNFFSSPGDPTFFLHHANVDRIWRIWQQESPSNFYEIGGPTSIYPPFGNLTYDFPLRMGNLGPTVEVGDVMDIESEPNCYIYV